MSSTLEYTYEYEPSHLDSNQALEKYKREKARHPGALIVLDEFDCGEHWKVDVYETEREKQIYFKKRWISMLERLRGSIVK